MGNTHKKNKKIKKKESDDYILISSLKNAKNKYMGNKHLICDDASTNRIVLGKFLTSFNCKYDEANNGKEAIEKVKEYGPYSIIWMDIKMPIMDGLEATRELRNEMEYDGIIIGLTGYVDEHNINKCHKAGINQVVAKPFDATVIEMYVNENKLM